MYLFWYSLYRPLEAVWSPWENTYLASSRFVISSTSPKMLFLKLILGFSWNKVIHTRERNTWGSLSYWFSAFFCCDHKWKCLPLMWGTDICAMARCGAPLLLCFELPSKAPVPLKPIQLPWLPQALVTESKMWHTFASQLPSFRPVQASCFKETQN